MKYLINRNLLNRKALSRGLVFDEIKLIIIGIYILQHFALQGCIGTKAKIYPLVVPQKMCFGGVPVPIVWDTPMTTPNHAVRLS